jgi:hypothetical protein
VVLQVTPISVSGTVYIQTSSRHLNIRKTGLQHRIIFKYGWISVDRCARGEDVGFEIVSDPSSERQVGERGWERKLNG